MKKLLNLVFFLLLLGSNSSLQAITVDGVLSEAEWKSANQLKDFYTVSPNTQLKPKYKTEVKYFSTQQGIFFGITNEQPISEQSLQKHPRDLFFADADRIFLMLDFEGKGNVGYEFTVSLGDSLRDAIVILSLIHI